MMNKTIGQDKNPWHPGEIELFKARLTALEVMSREELLARMLELAKIALMVDVEGSAIISLLKDRGEYDGPEGLFQAVRRQVNQTVEGV